MITYIIYGSLLIIYNKLLNKVQCYVLCYGIKTIMYKKEFHEQQKKAFLLLDWILL